ncbi:MAG: Hsp20/alpha crystallin family protein [Salinivirgaceae bacterium]|jgi:HSP20 family protein|nr:Hsp20/alpha crystallin family protein [Salinivirgaceae bacterium]MBR3566961.1 Hsp20/alpha crystallin family protein [Salinivirgaceae bacterium]MBR4621431.1 Hsp20/alpha crystallin family protein [Salinivirgaceae bacterium]MBR5642929.1 Hsp20/alpha crystallin family protein [Salinivirgaceae bacterium]
MTLARFNNYPSLFDQLFDTDLFDWSNRNYSETNTTVPSVNIKENADAFNVEMAVPGFDKKDFKIALDHNVLTISSEKKVENETKEGERFTRHEYSYQSFSRSFTLPEAANGDKISAKYDNGILNVEIPKREEAKPKPMRQIAIA